MTLLPKFEKHANELIEKFHIPAVSIGLYKKGGPYYYKGFGYRNKEEKLAVTPETVFGIASVTKSFTCVAIMQLQEAGKLSVHDKILKHLPEFKTPDAEKTAQMTIHHFMSNSSGLPPLPSLIYANKRSTDIDPSTADYGFGVKEGDNQEPIDTFEDLMEFIGKLDFELLGPPGMHFSYSNDAFALLGAIIERVSGVKYEEYMKENILKPAGMQHTIFDIADLGDYDNVAMSYAARTEENKTTVYQAPIWWDAPAMRAAGYLKSTVHDMLRYTEIYRNNGVVHGTRILSEESVKAMTYPYIEAEPGTYYGYGLTVVPDFFGYKLVEHGGNLKAIASLMSIIPELGITGMILTNLAGVPAGPMLRAALHDEIGQEIGTTPIKFTEQELSEEEAQKYVGTYKSNEGAEITIGVEEGKITFYSDEEYFPIKYVGNHLFDVNVKDQQEIVRFIENVDGAIDRIAYHYRQFPKVTE